MRQHLHLVFDFDGTITIQDTINVIAEYALENDGTEATRARWSQVVKDYLHDCDDYEASGSFPPPVDRHTIEDEAVYLNGRRGIEAKSLERVSKSQLFKQQVDYFACGVEAVRSGRVNLRAGFVEMIQELNQQSEGMSLSILSLNWSAPFIEGVLSATGFYTDNLKTRAKIYAGDITTGTVTASEDLRSLLHDSGASTMASMLVSGDKLRVLRLMQQHRDDRSPRWLYFGDSTTDLECLYEIGGVVIADSEHESKLIQSLRRLGQPVPRWQRGGNDKISWAPDFAEMRLDGFLASI